MTLNDISSIANLLAAIGVLITLIYLSRQVRPDAVRRATPPVGVARPSRLGGLDGLAQGSLHRGALDLRRLWDPTWRLGSDRAVGALIALITRRPFAADAN